MNDRPSYEEVVKVFAEYLASTNNDGDPVAPRGDDIERAFDVLEATGVKTDYYDFEAMAATRERAFRARAATEYRDFFARHGIVLGSQGSE